MIKYPEKLIELKSNVRFEILRSTMFPSKYRIKFAPKDRKKTNFDWYEGGVLGAEGHYVSMDDFPLIYAYKAFNSKKDAEEFIKRIYDIMQFSQLEAIQYD